MSGLGGDERRDKLTDNIRINPTPLGVELINKADLGRRTPAVIGGCYVGPLWEIVGVFALSGHRPAECVKNAVFDLLVQ